MSVRTASSVEALALKRYAQMQTGQIDRTQLTADYNNQLTYAAVQQVSQYLKEYNYGAAPDARRSYAHPHDR